MKTDSQNSGHFN